MMHPEIFGDYLYFGQDWKFARLEICVGLNALVQTCCVNFELCLALARQPLRFNCESLERSSSFVISSEESVRIRLVRILDTMVCSG